MTRTNPTDAERSIQTNREQPRARGAVSPQHSPGSGPFSLMRRMAEDMDRIFGLDLGRGVSRAAWTPQIETFRRGDQIVVRADLPGLKKDDVHVEVDDGLLSISGERREEHDENRDDFYRSERSYGQFYRAFPLPDGVNADAVDASFKDGVLEVTIAAPKQSQQKARQVQIR